MKEQCKEKGYCFEYSMPAPMLCDERCGVRFDEMVEIYDRNNSAKILEIFKTVKGKRGRKINEILKRL